jgi:hypothetical protein
MLINMHMGKVFISSNHQRILNKMNSNGRSNNKLSLLILTIKYITITTVYCAYLIFYIFSLLFSFEIILLLFTEV